MKIIILGAGQVGGTLAEHLAGEANDITVVDTDAERLRNLGDRLDIRTVQGRASFPTVLRQAGADDADMLVAVTNSDETNMVACQVAHTLFHTPTKIARVREAAYLTRAGLFDNDAIPVDVLISPEQVVTHYIKRLIEIPGALQVIDFADGKAQLVAVKAYYGGPLVGQQLRQLREHMPNVETRVAAIFRRDRPILPQGDTVIEADDEVFFIAAKANIRAVMSEMRRLDETYKRIVIAGGGQIGERLAEAIESRYQVKIIEMSPARCRHLSDTLDSTVVLQGSASDRDLLMEENIADADIFVAAGQAAGGEEGDDHHQQPGVCRPGPGRRYRHRHQPAVGHHRHLAHPRAPWRYRQRTLPAQGRGGSHRGDRPWRFEVEQGHRQGHPRHRPTAGHHHRRDHSR
jgi:trk system potassium uptake protein